MFGYFIEVKGEPRTTMAAVFGRLRVLTLLSCLDVCLSSPFDLSWALFTHAD